MFYEPEHVQKKRQMKKLMLASTNYGSEEMDGEAGSGGPPIGSSDDQMPRKQLNFNLGSSNRQVAPAVGH